MLRKLIAALFVLVSAPAAFASTQEVTISGSSWVEIGTGPLLVENLQYSNVRLAQSASQPNEALGGHILRGNTARTFCNNIKVWAKPVKSSTQPVTVSVGEGSCGSTGTIEGSLAAGSNIIGQVGIDQSTPGTTNLVQVGGTLPSFATPPTFNVGTIPVSMAGFAPGGNYATLAVTNATGRVALPTGAVVVVTNAGNNAAFVRLGNNAVEADNTNDFIAPGGAISFTVGANTHLAAITNASTTTLNVSGGTGILSGWGGSGSLEASVSQSGTWTVQPGNTANTTPWLTRLGDGTNNVAIKAPSTAAMAADRSLVVSVSPNNTVAVTQSGTWTVQPGNTANTTPWLAQIGDGSNAAAIKAPSTAAQAADRALVVAVSPNNTVASAQSGTWTVQPGDTQNTTPWRVLLDPGTSTVGATTPAAATTGGATPYKLTNTAASTNSTSVKGSAGTLYTLSAVNGSGSVLYLKLYDVSSAPTCNSSTIVQTYPIHPVSTGFGLTISFPVGIAFSNGIGFCVTAGVADSDNSNASAGVTISMTYK